jgi:hypothetical protein
VEKDKGLTQAHETFKFRFSMHYLRKGKTTVAKEHLAASD